MHKARHHNWQSTDPSTLRQRAIRQGKITPEVVRKSVAIAQANLEGDIRSGALRPGQRLGIAETSRRYGDIGTTSVRQMFYRLGRLTPPLVHQKEGAFYVMSDEVAAAATKRKEDRPPPKKTARTAEQLRSLLGVRYPIGSALPVGSSLAASFNVSEDTANRAVKVLEAQGLVNKHREVIALSPTAQTTPDPKPEPEPLPEPVPPEPEPETHAHTQWSDVKEDQQAADKRPTVRKHIISQIQSGIHPVGSTLPSETVMANMAGVKHQSIEGTYLKLARDGYIEHRAGGWVVLRTEPTERLERRMRSAEQAPAPTPIPDSDDGEGESFVMDLLRGMLAETRRSWARVEELNAKIKELQARPDDKATVLSLRNEVTQLKALSKETGEALDRMRGVMHRQEEENAELRGQLERRKRNGFASFGPDVRNNIGAALNMKPGELEKLMQTARER